MIYHWPMLYFVFSSIILNPFHLLFLSQFYTDNYAFVGEPRNLIQCCVYNFKVFYLSFKYFVISFQEKLINPNGR